MIRGDNIVCGTSTTGTGTLTLAATPGPPGGIDFDVFARATGIGFGNSAAVLVSYTIIEYTDSTFATAKATEKGIGTLTLGGSAGIANCTLARTTLQTSATSLNSQPATQNIAPGTGISIGTAANTLVFIGASAADVLAFSPYVDTTGGNIGSAAQNCGGYNINNPGGPVIATGVHYYYPFIWPRSGFVKQVSMYVGTAYATGAPVSNAYAHIYDPATTGKPGKLLIDFGLLGSANTSLNGSTQIQSAALANAMWLQAGAHIFDFVATLSGGSTSPKMTTWDDQWGGAVDPGLFGTININNSCSYASSDASGAANPAPDPAYTTGWTQGSGANQRHVFYLK